MAEVGTIPARRGKAITLKAGQSVKLINTHGHQVVDTWAFVSGHMIEFMSMEHTRPTIMKMIPEASDHLYTNKRRPILTLVEDTTPGNHDTIMAACDNERYGLLGCKEYHDNCTDNLYGGMREIGLTPPEVPQPFNIFMNIPWNDAGRLAWGEPTSKPGDYVTLRAEIDCIVAFSACPQDILPINGVDVKPTEAHYEILG